MKNDAAISFRDPTGYCRVFEDKVLRFVSAEGTADLEAFLDSACARNAVSAGRLIPTRPASEADLTRWREQASPAMAARMNAGRVFEHERLWFPSYPHEWTPAMLFQAGRLTLDLAETALAEGFGLKDATPFNILFRGCQPVFVDLLSFERRNPGDPTWLPCAQFVRTFLLPLLANQRRGLRLADLFTTRRDGLEPQEVYRLCGPLERLMPPALSLVSLPTWLSGRAEHQGNAIYQNRTLNDPDKARFIVASLLKRLRRTLESLNPGARETSAWSRYMATHSYPTDSFAAKETFVSRALDEFKPRRVLDIGANTGHFSVMAANAGARVVAMDVDPVCVGAIGRQAQDRHLDILPLVVNLARPSAALGWRNRECLSFLERASGAFDCIFLLATLHHLLVTERVPLDDVMSLAAFLTTGLAVVEFVGPQDAMFRRLARGRDHLHNGLDCTAFETACRPHFDVVRTAPLDGTHRQLYLLRKKSATP